MDICFYIQHFAFIKPRPITYSYALLIRVLFQWLLYWFFICQTR